MSLNQTRKTNTRLKAGRHTTQVLISDVSTAGSYWTTSPVSGKITKIDTVLSGAITGADAGITVELGGTAVTGGAITIANSGSAAGDVDTATPTALNTVTAGGAIEVITDGASTGSRTVNVTLTIEADA